ncbi:MAG TPA: hypothetical protein VLE99_03060 [Candidatus Saccharimonadales bacterium]|nr:hypothetical protein [Candidatus Saccharimonadales bacterium]
MLSGEQLTGQDRDALAALAQATVAAMRRAFAAGQVAVGADTYVTGHEALLEAGYPAEAVRVAMWTAAVEANESGPRRVD